LQTDDGPEMAVVYFVTCLIHCVVIICNACGYFQCTRAADLLIFLTMSVLLVF
jgi:hypothetical protein